MVFQWDVRVGQRLQSSFGQSGAVRELNLVQIVDEVSAIRGGLPSTWLFELLIRLNRFLKIEKIEIDLIDLNRFKSI